MTDTRLAIDEAKGRATNAVRFALGAAGLTALIAGILILAAPSKTAQVIAGIIAVYALIAGLANIVVAAFTKGKNTGARVGYGALGLLFIVAGVLALQNLSLFALGLAVTLSVLVGVLWIIEGVVSLTQLKDASSKVWSIIFAALSVIAGITLLISPIWGAVVLWWLLGISLVILGAIQIVRAFRFGR